MHNHLNSLEDKISMETGEIRIKWIYDLVGWFETHRRLAILLISGIVGVILVTYALNWSAAQKHLEAGSHLYKLLNNLDENQTNLDQLVVFATKYSKTTAAQRALLVAAIYYYKNQEFERAHQIFQNLLKTYPKSEWAPIALLGIASCLDAQNQIQAAEDAYKRLIQEYGAHPVAVHARLKLGLLYESMDRIKEALQIYEDSSNPTIYGRSAIIAAQRKQQLLRIYPHLLQTNLPTASATQSVRLESIEHSPEPLSTTTNLQNAETNLTNSAIPPETPLPK